MLPLPSGEGLGEGFLSLLQKFPMKKILFSLLLLCIFSGISEISAQNTVNTRFPYFSDVQSSHKNFFAITDLMQRGVINGYADGTFQPDKPVSRAETLKILLLGSQINAPKLTLSQKKSEIFSDVENTEWYARYVQEAKKRKIVKGRGDSGKFFPADTVNKAEALKMLLLVNRQKISDAHEKPYNDVEISDWFSGYFMQAQEKKLFDQSSSQNVHPAQTLTRGDLVEMMYRYQQQKLKREFSGIIDPAGTQHPEILPAIEKDAWDGILLDKNLIPVFRKGEITEISGKIFPANSSDTVSLIVTNAEGKSFTFSGDSRDGKFSIPVFFKETGDIQIGILKGKSGTYITYSGKVFSGIADDSSEISSPPENFVAKHYLGKLLLMWDKNGNDVFHIQFRQNERVKNIYVNRKNSVLVPTSVFEGFKQGEIQVFIRGAKASDFSSLNLITKFSDPQKIKISVFERFTETISDDIEILSANYEYDNTISVKGRIKKSKNSGNAQVQFGKGYVLNTQEELFEKKLEISGNAS